MINLFAAVATFAITIYGLLHLFLHYTQDEREPPLVSNSVPFIGTIIGLSRKKSKFYVETSQKHNLPIFTLRIPGARLYVINSTSLISVVQRQHKILAFPPLESKLSQSVCGTSKTCNDIMNTNTNGDDGNWGYVPTFHKAMYPALSPGPQLDAMNRVMAQKVTACMDQLFEQQKEKKPLRLFEYIQHEITLATTGSVYGPQNPFNDPMMEKSFWKFQSGIMVLIMNFFPSILAKESIQSREFMTKAFTRYFKDGSHNQGSSLIRARYAHSTEHQVPVEDIARLETGGAIGILTNTSPTSFWMVYHLYSTPVALEDCRSELSKVITTEESSGIKIRTIDMSQVKTSCPILLSTLQEVLRLHGIGISTRMVMEDHLLDNRYLLKKGNTVMIPGPVQHKNADIWGSNVEEFDHRRFLPGNKRHSAVAFRGFGGGTTLCPGRHFSSTEVLAFTAILLLRFDIKPVRGKWPRLTTDKAEMWETTPIPDNDVEVMISPRDSKEDGVKWRILVSDSDKAMPLSAEDL